MTSAREEVEEPGGFQRLGGTLPESLEASGEKQTMERARERERERERERKDELPGGGDCKWRAQTKTNGRPGCGGGPVGALEGLDQGL